MRPLYTGYHEAFHRPPPIRLCRLVNCTHPSVILSHTTDTALTSVFPPRRCLPTGCLYYLRVWLRTGGIDHRLFADKDIWFGKDPDFRAIADASFAYLRNATQDMSIYQGMVGHAHVSFIFRSRSPFPLGSSKKTDCPSIT